MKVNKNYIIGGLIISIPLDIMFIFLLFNDIESLLFIVFTVSIVLFCTVKGLNFIYKEMDK